MSKRLSEKKYEDLMRAAVELFSRQGFHATPAQQISDLAGVSVGTLFKYFGTKENLIDTLYFSIHQTLSEVVEEAVSSADSVEEKIKNAKRQVLIWMFKNPEKTLFFENFSSSSSITKKAKEEALDKFSVLDDLYQKAVSRGIIVKTDKEVFLANFWYPNFMLINLYTIGRLRSNIEEIIEQSTSSMWSGIGRNL
ncbi:AcrR family transcriptional regulator [Methanomicrobium sp. W14]|uniref:TetR/AcrR family transcriptional regulator n=1 Tax=Methanomicrobium sp. W14 TaxID=2817839 RepID=UPI001AE2E5BF|nr:TetR/AcrR family transcriptional regulator [Methanomicrobium sp. W14]MBP2134009.1 AcrR family transcriptional regulator [Methanomicrobium sp. W14]